MKLEQKHFAVPVASRWISSGTPTSDDGAEQRVTVSVKGARVIRQQGFGQERQPWAGETEGKSMLCEVILWAAFIQGFV
jgi:hypothetical protein